MTIDEIIEIVAFETTVSVADIKGTSQITELVEARYIAIDLVFRNFPKISQKAVGNIFNRHRTTIIHAQTSVNDWLLCHRAFKKKHKACLDRLMQKEEAA